MEDCAAAIEQALADYRAELEAAEKKKKPTDGLLGFGRSIQDDPCHEKLDQRLGKIVEELRAGQPSSKQAEEAVRLLLLRGDASSWPTSAQWMLRAEERHALPLIPFLTPDAAAALFRQYHDRYRPWERLPVQKQVYKALKARGEQAR